MVSDLAHTDRTQTSSGEEFSNGLTLSPSPPFCPAGPCGPKGPCGKTITNFSVI